MVTLLPQLHPSHSAPWPAPSPTAPAYAHMRREHVHTEVASHSHSPHHRLSHWQAQFNFSRPRSVRLLASASCAALQRRSCFLKILSTGVLQPLAGLLRFEDRSRAPVPCVPKEPQRNHLQRSGHAAYRHTITIGSPRAPSGVRSSRQSLTPLH